MNPRKTGELPNSWRQVCRRLEILGAFLLLMWLVVLLDFLLPGLNLTRFGVVPRSLRGLIGVPLAPLLHDGFTHVAANSLPLLVLGGLLIMRSLRDWLRITIIVTLLSGLGVWLIGRGGSVHVGASGLVLGYFGCILALAYLERTPAALLLAAVVALIYGGLLWGLLPQSESVSWEYHLCGLLSGIAAASFVNRRRRTDQSE